MSRRNKLPQPPERPASEAKPPEDLALEESRAQEAERITILFENICAIAAAMTTNVYLSKQGESFISSMPMAIAIGASVKIPAMALRYAFHGISYIIGKMASNKKDVAAVNKDKEEGNDLGLDSEEEAIKGSTIMVRPDWLSDRPKSLRQPVGERLDGVTREGLREGR